MATELEQAKKRLEQYEARHSPSGLLRRYARQRVKYCWLRQIFTLGVTPVFFLTGQPFTGLLAIALLIVGEAVDCGFLKLLPNRLSQSENLARLRHLSTLTALVHSLTVAAVVLLPAGLESSSAAIAFSLAFLVAAGINSSFSLSFHPVATYVRLAVILITALAFIAIHIARFGLTLTEFWYVFFAFGLSVFTVNAFANQMQIAFKRKLLFNKETLKQSFNIALTHQELQNQETENRKLALVAENASDSIFITNAEGVIIWINDAFTRLTEYTPKDAIGQTPAKLLNGPETDQTVSDAIATAIAEARPMRAEIFNLTKSGEHIWVETNQVPVLDQDGQVEMVLAIERNISAAKRHEAELDAAKCAAENGERAKAQFLATMSHEIRTPMNGIIGMADLLSDTAMTREHRNYVNTIKFSAEALLRIINDILDFSKFDAGKSIISLEDFNLLGCIESALSILRPKALEKGIFLDLDCLTPIPEALLGDAGRIRQILINIVGNAIKFTQNGGVTLQLSLVQKAGKVIVNLDVKDTGIGIEENQLNLIFDEFSQADGEITRKFGGTGLGLTISRLLAREMGGDITVTSEPGHGSTFSIQLTLYPSAAKPSSTDEDETSAALELKLPGIKALVAEDNMTNQLLMKTYLKDTEMDVLYARDGVEAVKLAKRHGPRIIFMDMSMPEMGGVEATRAIRKADIPQPTIIALTANVFASDKAACLSAGMDGFLPKPLKRRDLINCLSQL